MEQNNTLPVSMGRRWGNWSFHYYNSSWSQSTSSIPLENVGLTLWKRFIWGPVCPPVRWKKPVRATIEKQNGQPHPPGRREGEKKRGSRKSQEAQSDFAVVSPDLACEQRGNPLWGAFPLCNRQIGGSEQNNGDLLWSQAWCSSLQTWKWS